MFWLPRSTFAGSYRRLSACRRAYFSGPVRGADPVRSLVAEEVHVHAAGAVRLQRRVGVARPPHVRLGLLVVGQPDRVDVHVVTFRALAERGLVLGDARHRPAELEDDDVRARRGDPLGLRDEGVDRPRRSAAGSPRTSSSSASRAGRPGRTCPAADIGTRGEQVDQRRAEAAQRRERALALGRVARPADADRDDGLAVHLRREERQRRRLAQVEDRGQLVRRRGDEVAVVAQHARARPRARSRAARRGPSGRRDAAGTRTRSRRRSCRRLRAGPTAGPRSALDDRAVRRDDLGAEQVVDGRAAAAHQPADAAAEREAGDPRVRDDAAGRREPVRLRRVRRSSPHRAPPCARAVRASASTVMRRIGDRSITRPSARIACPPTPCPPPRTDTSSSRSRARRERVRDVVRVAAAGDQRGAAVDRAVPDRARGVVGGVARREQLALERGGRHAGDHPSAPGGRQVQEIDSGRGGPDVRPVLPGRPRIGDPRDALDADHRPQPAARRAHVQRDPGRRAWDPADPAQPAPATARAARDRRAAPRPALRPDRRGTGARGRRGRAGRLGLALARARARASRRERGPVGDVPPRRRRRHPRPPARHPLRRLRRSPPPLLGRARATRRPRSASSPRGSTRISWCRPAPSGWRSGTWAACRWARRCTRARCRSRGRLSSCARSPRWGSPSSPRWSRRVNCGWVGARGFRPRRRSLARFARTHVQKAPAKPATAAG